MNFLDVSTENGRLVHPEFEYRVSDETLAAVDGHTDLVLGARPEDIELTDGNERNGIEAFAQVVEPLGDFSHLHAIIGEDQLTVTVDAQMTIPNNKPLTLSFPEERIYLFDRHSGVALKNSAAPIEKAQLTTV